MSPTSAALPVLVVRAGSRLAALPLGVTRETMRPLPVEAVRGAPAFVAGMSVLRGEPAPVVDLGGLIGAPGAGVGRFVSVDAGRGQAFLLAVDEVLGVRRLPTASFDGLPRLLGAEAAGVVAAVAVHDERIVMLIDAARLVPDEVWAALAARGAAS